MRMVSIALVAPDTLCVCVRNLAPPKGRVFISAFPSSKGFPTQGTGLGSSPTWAHCLLPSLELQMQSFQQRLQVSVQPRQRVKGCGQLVTRKIGH